MTHYHFIGRVHPERGYLTVNGGPLWVNQNIQGWAGDSATIKAHIQIDHAQLHVIIEDPPDWLAPLDDNETLKNLAEQLARNAVDVAGFTNARGYDVEIVSGWKEGQMAKTYGVEVAEVAALAKESKVNFLMLFQESVRSPSLGRALADFREAIRSPVHTAFHCERALESMTRHFSDGDQAKSSDWSQMGEVLQVDKTVKDQIAKRAKQVRHGGSDAASAVDRVQWLSWTFQIIERFVVFRHGGDKPLDVAAWSLLRAGSALGVSSDSDRAGNPG